MKITIEDEGYVLSKEVDGSIKEFDEAIDLMGLMLFNESLVTKRTKTK